MRIFKWFQHHFDSVYKTMLFVMTVMIIVQLFPRLPRFGYDYQQGRPWTYPDLIAPFDFAILKSKAELDAEKELVMDEFRPFFHIDKQVADRQKEQFELFFDSLYGDINFGAQALGSMDVQIEPGKRILDTLFRKGIVFLDETTIDKPGDYEIRLTEGPVAEIRRLEDLYTIPQALEYIWQQSEIMGYQDHELLRVALENALIHNVFYDPELSRRALDAELEQLPLSRGMIQQGEKIVSKGELISHEKYQIIESYKSEYLKIKGETASLYLLYAGQLLLVGISIVVLVWFLYVFRRDVFSDNRRILLILLTVLLMVFLTSLVIKYNSDFLFLLPVCIVPVVIRAFFDNRLALYVHINTIILVGFLIPRSFDFVFLQFIAGIIVILSMVSLRRRSQLFFTAILIFFTYATVYLGLSLAHGGTFADMKLIDYMYFGGGALFTLFAYPLIFLFERIFRLPTDFSLLELADTNNEILRQLNLKAPGTFQHSLQVANLAEEAIFAIGGNALLTRTGALYHDIGKMDDPMYFIENQVSEYNPHEELSFRDSAAIIIDHVIKGIEMGRKKNLPEYIIDFIRTHHGTTTARYFYSMQIKENPKIKPDKKDFAYPGPKPFSKETAVVMMADSVEAASRSFTRPDEEQINKLVDSIIDTQMLEKQFENAPITFRDFEVVKRLFKLRLMNIFHIRISYPSIN